MNGTGTNCRKLLLTSLLLNTIAVCTVYGRVVGHDYLRWDDLPVIVQNPHLHGITSDNLAWIFSSVGDGMWMPVTYLSYLLSFSLFGTAPATNLLVNPFLHMLNATLVVGLLYRVLVHVRPSHSVHPFYTALLGGLLFAVHPVNVEAVAWLTGRREVLCTLFYLLSVQCWMTSRKQPQQARRWQVAAWTCQLLALGSNPIAVTLPALFVVIDYCVYGMRLELRQVARLWPYWLSSVLMVPLAMWAEASVGALPDLQHVAVATRLLQCLDNYVFYLREWLLPLQLSPYYPSVQDVRALPLLADVFVLALVVWLFVWAIRRDHRLLLLAVLWYVITFAPASGLVQVAMHRVADRYAYLPMVALCGFFAVCCVQLVGRWRVFVVVLLLAVAVFASTSYRQVAIWKNERVLWEYVVAREPDAYLPLSNLAGEYMRQGYPEQALRLFHRAVDLHPENRSCLQQLIKACALLEQWRCAVDASDAGVTRFPEDASFPEQAATYRERLRASDAGH